jgi:hypothetical protein
MATTDPQAEHRRWITVAVAGAAIAAVSIPLAAADGAPYLSLESISPWLVTYAVGLFAALFAAPFLIRDRLGGRLEGDARWERALVLWGVLAVGVLAIGLALGLAGDFASGSLAGSLGAVTAVEAVLVLATLGVWVLSS